MYIYIYVDMSWVHICMYVRVYVYIFYLCTYVLARTSLYIVLIQKVVVAYIFWIYIYAHTYNLFRKTAWHTFVIQTCPLVIVSSEKPYRHSSRSHCPASPHKWLTLGNLAKKVSFCWPEYAKPNSFVAKIHSPPKKNWIMPPCYRWLCHDYIPLWYPYILCLMVKLSFLDFWRFKSPRLDDHIMFYVWIFMSRMCIYIYTYCVYIYMYIYACAS